MIAAFVQDDSTLKAEECPTPEPTGDDILVKIEYCGLCGSDINMLNAGIFPPGSIVGHEITGHIAKTGQEAGGWKEGDRIAVFPLDPCMKCPPCKRGEVQHCTENIARRYGIGLLPGGFAEYMIAKPSMLFKIPESLDMKTAALTEPFAVSYRGVNLSGIKEGAPCLIMGAGPIGLFCIPALKSKNAGKIFVAEPDSYRAEIAAKLGADRVFDPNKKNAADVMKNEVGAPPSCIFECAGTEESMMEAAYSSDSEGHVIMLGFHQGTISILPLIWFNKEISLSFSLGYNMKEFGQCITHLADGAVDPDVMISKVIKLEEIDSVFHPENRKNFAKILIDCS